MYYNLLSNIAWTLVGTTIIYNLPFRILTEYNILVKCGFSLIVAEVWFYHIHIMLHQSQFYSRFHKQHHEFVKPYALTALYGSAFEAVVCNLMAVSLGPVLTQMEPSWLYLWFAGMAINSTLSHSGLKYGWVDGSHDVHHSKYIYNYGLLGILDKIYQTEHKIRSEIESKEYNPSSEMTKIVVTIVFWTTIAVFNVMAGILVFFFDSPSDIRKIIEIVIAQYTTTIMIKLGWWKVNTIDRRSEWDEPVIIVSNHTSLIDTIFTAQLPYDKVYTWKKKWLYTPIFGQLCWLGHHIIVSEDTKHRVLNQAELKLKDRISVMFYPEGTRNFGSGLLPFKTGAFRLANKTGTKILPVTLIGTKEACDGWVCNSAEITIVIDQPVKIESINEGIEEVRKIILSNLQ